MVMQDRAVLSLYLAGVPGVTSVASLLCGNWGLEKFRSLATLKVTWAIFVDVLKAFSLSSLPLPI